MSTALSGCLAMRHDAPAPFDPWRGFNRASYGVTEAVDRVATRPLARGYAAVLPGPMEAGVRNFFQNLRTPLSALNGLLQGKPGRAGRDLGRFLVNSTVGMLGLVDVAQRVGIDFQDEDLGQTLAVWGYRRSRILYLPILGPTTVRDLPGDVLDRFLAPRWLLGEGYGWEAGLVDTLSLRADTLTATDARDATALDPYAFTVEAWHQRRRFEIWDGAPPVVDLLDEAFDEGE